MNPGDMVDIDGRFYLILDAAKGGIIGVELEGSPEENRVFSPDITKIHRFPRGTRAKVIKETDPRTREGAWRNLIMDLCRRYFENRDLSKRSDYIPASGKVLDEKDLINLVDASLDMWLTSGRFNREFEGKLGKLLGIEYAITINSGSSANLLAISALTSHKLGNKRLKPGDEVITVAAGFPTTVTPIIQNGLIPVFVDVQMGTYNIDTVSIEKAISDRTGAIISAHTLGNPFNLEQIGEIARKYDLWLVEDNCDALGAKYGGRYTGTYGDIGTFSFYPAHHITMGEGGAVVTSSEILYTVLKSMRDWGRDCWCEPGKDNTCGKRFEQKHGKLPAGYDHKYVFSHLGYNLKITDWQAAVGLSQLSKLPAFIRKRQENFSHLYEGLQPFEENLILPLSEPASEPCWFGFPITVKEGAPFSRKEIISYLEQKGIGTRLLFAGNILRQPAFTDNTIKLRISDSPMLSSERLGEEHMAKLKNSEHIMEETFWIGTFPGLGASDLDYVISTFREFCR